MQNQGIAVKGMFRVHITEDDEIVGDSGWKTNVVTNEGFRNYLVRLLGAIASSSQIGYAALGTGTEPAAAATTLAGEVDSRASVTAASSSDSKAVQFTATFSSGDSPVPVISTSSGNRTGNCSSGTATMPQASQ